MAQNAPVPCESVPAELATRIVKRYGPRHCVEMFHPHLRADEVRHVVRERKAMLAAKGKAASEMLASGPFDFIGIGFSDLHATGHAFWDFHVDPGHPVGDALRVMYSQMDAEVGRIVGALPESASIVLLATYGLKPEYPTVDLPEAVLRMLGYQQSPDRPGGKSWRDMLPIEWRMHIGRRLPLSVQEHWYNGWMTVRGATPPEPDTMDLRDLAPWLSSLLPGA